MLQRIRDHQKFESKDLRILRQRTQDDVESQLLVIQTPFGYRRIAELFRPTVGGSFAAILYSHWYEPGSPDSNLS